MDLPGFARRRDDLVWTQRGRTLKADTPDVMITAQSAWYSARWTVTGVSHLLLPEEATLYISRSGAAHGYWRNAPPGMAGYFGYSDVPALMPILIGRNTRDAIKQHDSPSWATEQQDLRDTRESVALHIRGRSVETTTKIDNNDSGAIDDLLAIHHALIADHERLLDDWKSAADQLSGTVETRWPPLITVPRPHGSTTIALRWSPSTAMGSEAWLELTADARGAKLWSLELEPRATPNSIEIGERQFLVMGDIPIAKDALDRIVTRADLLSINVRRYVIVRIARSTPDVALLDSLLDLIGELCGAKSEPYR
jgi:hypothetical protein